MNAQSRIVVLVLILLCVAAFLLFAAPDPVSAGSFPQEGPTPEPQQTGAASAVRLPPWVGILVLLAPLGFMAWKSRGAKTAKITASCCLPVVEDGQSPFQIYEDDPK